MNDFSQSNRLYWDATYEIVLALRENYPNEDVDRVGLEALFQYIVTLPNFADDLEIANEGILNEILRVWYEEVNL
jgi:FeS assembly protein IscX